MVNPLMPFIKVTQDEQRSSQVNNNFPINYLKIKFSFVYILYILYYPNAFKDLVYILQHRSNIILQDNQHCFIVYYNILQLCYVSSPALIYKLFT
jgi:hypothetical protein